MPLIHLCLSRRVWGLGFDVAAGVTGAVNGWGAQEERDVLAKCAKERRRDANGRKQGAAPSLAIPVHWFC